jgi:hypothetical protein
VPHSKLREGGLARVAQVELQLVARGAERALTV